MGLEALAGHLAPPPDKAADDNALLDTFNGGVTAKGDPKDIDIVAELHVASGGPAFNAIAAEFARSCVLAGFSVKVTEIADEQGAIIEGVAW